MKICPKCGEVLAYNYYFGAYICDKCNWEDASEGIKRNMGIENIQDYVSASRVIAKKIALAK